MRRFDGCRLPLQIACSCKATMMSIPTLDRKLLAILAADVVGFSKAMEADEAGTIARLKASRTELVDPLIAQHHGRIVKLMGDGALVAFDSVVDAVVCAVEIQKAADCGTGAVEVSVLPTMNAGGWG